MSLDIKKIRRRNTVEYKFTSLSLDPQKPFTLHVRPYSADTPEVINDSFRWFEDVAKLKTSHERRIANRRGELTKIGRCCIDSWDNVAEGGTALECSPDAAVRVLLEILDAGFIEELDEFITFVSTTRNFREAVQSAEQLGKQ